MQIFQNRPIFSREFCDLYHRGDFINFGSFCEESLLEFFYILLERDKFDSTGWLTNWLLKRVYKRRTVNRPRA